MFNLLDNPSQFKAAVDSKLKSTVVELINKKKLSEATSFKNEKDLIKDLKNQGFKEITAGSWVLNNPKTKTSIYAEFNPDGVSVTLYDGKGKKL